MGQVEVLKQDRGGIKVSGQKVKRNLGEELIGKYLGWGVWGGMLVEYGGCRIVQYKGHRFLWLRRCIRSWLSGGQAEDLGL